MERLIGARQSYDWGSTAAIPELLGERSDDRPWAGDDADDWEPR